MGWKNINAIIENRLFVGRCVFFTVLVEASNGDPVFMQPVRRAR